jgi:hypothetical protein
METNRLLPVCIGFLAWRTSTPECGKNAAPLDISELHCVTTSNTESLQDILPLPCLRCEAWVPKGLDK